MKEILAKEFFTVLYQPIPNREDLFYELRLIKPDPTDPKNPKKTKRESHFYEWPQFLHLQESQAYAPIRAKNEQGYNVYFGINPRLRKHGKKADVACGVCLYAEVDAKDFLQDQDAKDNEVLEAIVAIKPQVLTHIEKVSTEHQIHPSILIDSGRGYHLYWLLTKVAPFPENGQRQALIQNIERLNNVLKQLFHGDSIGNVDRIFRYPGSYNRKPVKVGSTELAKLPVKILRFNPDLRYPLETFHRLNPLEAKPQQKHTPSVQQKSSSADIGLRAALDVLLKTGIPGTIGRNEFVGLCGAFKHEGIDYDTFDTIMQKTDGYDADENLTIWNSVKDETHEGSKTTAGTIVNYAKAADPEAYTLAIESLQSKPPNPAGPESSATKPAESQESEKEQIPENTALTQEVLTNLQQTFQVVKDVTFDLRQHHPILRHYYKLVQPNIDAKPQTVITPFLSALATNIGNKACIHFRGRPHFCNVWSIIIAPSTIGRKTSSLEMALKALRQYDLELQKEYKRLRRAYDREIKKNSDYAEENDPPVHQHIILPTASSERFFQILQDSPNSIMVFSEIASLLTKLNKSYNSDLKSVITAMFDSFVPSKHETMNRSDSVECPCFSIAAATTKEWLLKELDKDADIGSGFMQRFLICNSHDIDFNRLDFSFKEGKDTQSELNNYLQRLYNGLRQIGSPDNPVELTLSEGAKQLYKETNEAIFKKLLQAEDNLLCSYAGRCFTDYFLRFSMIFTLAEWVEHVKQKERDIHDFSSYDLEVREETARDAMKLCQFYFQNIASFLKNEVAENRELRNEKILVRILEKKPQGGFTSRSELKNLSHLRQKEFNEALESLLDRGIVDEMKGKKANNGITPRLYKLNIQL